MAKQSRRRKRKRARAEAKRTQGFHCAWCFRSNCYNERFVPDYYRGPEGHRRDTQMCLACHLEGAGSDGRGRPKHRGKTKPHVTPETLEAFWREDTSDGDPVRAAMSYFGCKRKEVEEARDQIKV